MPGAGVGIGIEEAAHGGVIVAGLEIIETVLVIVVIAAIAEGVEICKGGAGCLFVDEVVATAVEDAGQLAPRVVGVGGVGLLCVADDVAVGILNCNRSENLHHVALLVQGVEIVGKFDAVVLGILDRKRTALCIVGEDHDLGRAVCAGMLFLALKISLIWFYQKCCKQRKCRCMIQNIAGARK